jgi:hypothetical protein
MSLLPYDRWIAEAKRLYVEHGEVLGPFDENEGWRELHSLGWSPEQAVLYYLEHNQ